MDEKEKELSIFKDIELEEELARRRAAKWTTLDAMNAEESAEQTSVSDVGRAMASFLRSRESEQTSEKQPCPTCGTPCGVRRKYVERKVRSRGGEHRLRRHYHYCEGCRSGFYPLDIKLGLPAKGELTPRMERLVLDMGVHAPFEEAAERFSMHHGVYISENLVRLVVERVGQRASQVDTLQQRLREPEDEVPETLIVEVDGSMISTRGDESWREVKLGVVFRQEALLDNKGRGLISKARFVARLGDLNGFRAALSRALTLERAWDDGVRIVVVGDGAPWVWGLADELCHEAIEVLDYPHAMEHVMNAGKALFGEEQSLLNLWREHFARRLWAGQVDALVHELEQCAFAANSDERVALLALHRYFNNNASRMRYDLYREMALPCGSGSIESAHRHVLQKRMKLAGQHWDPQRADRLAQLRAAQATAGPARLYSAIGARIHKIAS